MAATEHKPGPLELGAQARALVRSKDRGALATAMKEDGWPYASLVMIACDAAANPLLMISELAEHTQNILSQDRVGLLIDGTEGLDNPLTGARVTLIGRAAKTTDKELMARYVARHADAALYAGFADFALYRLEVERVHMVAGFGAIHWIEKPAYTFDLAHVGALMAAEADIVSHMNEDHADAIQLYATGPLRLAGEGWVMTGVDPEGFDLRNGGTVARLAFDAPVGTAEEARAALVALVGKARKTG
jgi:putative heme iron utilization protein